MEGSALPIVYSCSGCSSAAQTANWIAIRMDRRGIAEMSCIAGVGGGVPALTAKARAAAAIIGLDGCPLACVKACLKRENIECTHHYDLSKYGIRREVHKDFDAEDAGKALDLIVGDLKTKRG